MENRLLVNFWRGTRSEYNELGENGSLDYATRYTVIETDGRRNEYFGSKPIVQATGELYPVMDVVTSLPSTLNVGDRYLVGHDATDDTEAEYYVVEIAADMSESTINPLGNLSIRIISKNLKTYQIVNGKLITYDGSVDCGTF